jgi:hypothetical protein
VSDPYRSMVAVDESTDIGDRLRKLSDDAVTKMLNKAMAQMEDAAEKGALSCVVVVPAGRRDCLRDAIRARGLRSWDGAGDEYLWISWESPIPPKPVRRWWAFWRAK